MASWLVAGDRYCSGGAYTGDLCGWQVTLTNVTHRYSTGQTLRNGIIAKKFSGSCTRNGDSGGPLYAWNCRTRPTRSCCRTACW